MSSPPRGVRGGAAPAHREARRREAGDRPEPSGLVTGACSPSGLAGLLLLWLAARLLLLSGTAWLQLAAAADLAFAVALFIAIARPVLKVRQRRQTPVLLVLALLAAGNAAFYLGALAGASEWVARGVYGGFYLVLGLVLFMGRRVIPFFAERGVGYEVELRNARWNDVASFVFYALFLVAEVLAPGSLAGAVVAALLFVLNGLRLAGWHTPGIWPPVREAVAIPLLVGGEVRFVLYGDNAPSARPCGPLDALESSAARAARIIEKTLAARS